jgi:hypothetical protein
MRLPERPSSGLCQICHSRKETQEVELPEPTAACPRCGWWYSVPDPAADPALAAAASESALDSWFQPGRLGRSAHGEFQSGPASGPGGWAQGPGPATVAHRRSRLSHLIRRQQRGRAVGVPVHSLELWSPDDPLPSPPEQADNLIAWIGDQQQSDYSKRVTIDLANAPAVAAWIGVPITRDDLGLIGWLAASQAGALLDLETGSDAIAVSLTLAGWAHHVALRRSASESRRAFMTMKFGDPQLNDVFDRCFKPAVARTGFTLGTVLEGQPAGQIDDQMRVGIRASRFMLADLTFGSQGAYWEAGFAEGLGRPVIYTCRKADWELQQTHFDTNHLVTIVWDPADLPDAARRLTATIRATLPGEAVVED